MPEGQFYALAIIDMYRLCPHRGVSLYMIFLLLGFRTPILESTRFIISVLWNYLKKVTKSGGGLLLLRTGLCFADGIQTVEIHLAEVTGALLKVVA